jgi:hypothetical protein
MHKWHRICSQSSANHKGYLCPHWGAHKEPDLSRSQTSLNNHQDLVWFSTIKSPWRRRQYKLSKVHHNLGDSWIMLVHLGDKSPGVTNTQRSLMKCFSWRFLGSLKRVAQISLRKLEFEWRLRERRFELKRVFQSVCKWSKWPNELRGRGGPFIAPKRNLLIEVLGIQTCLGWKPDMSTKVYWNPALAPDMSGAGT